MERLLTRHKGESKCLKRICQKGDSPQLNAIYMHVASAPLCDIAKQRTYKSLHAIVTKLFNEKQKLGKKQILVSLSFTCFLCCSGG